MDRKDLRYGRPYRLLFDVTDFKKGDLVYYCGYLEDCKGHDSGRIFSKGCIMKKGPGLTFRQWLEYGFVWLILPVDLEKVSKRELKGK